MSTVDARIIEQVVRVVATRGRGTPDDPCRRVVTYFSRKGEYLAENDPCAPRYDIAALTFVPPEFEKAPSP